MEKNINDLVQKNLQGTQIEPAAPHAGSIDYGRQGEGYYLAATREVLTISLFTTYLAIYLFTTYPFTTYLARY